MEMHMNISPGFQYCPWSTDFRHSNYKH